METVALDCKREKSLLLEIVRSFFHPNHEQIDYRHIDQKILFNLIRETASDGICYHVLKRTENLPWLVSQLESRMEIASMIDQHLEEAFVEIRRIPIPKVVLKDGGYRFTPNYLRGTRYGCDIDYYIDQARLNEFDRSLETRNFYSEGAELGRTANLIDLAYEINKDIVKYVPFQESLRPMIERFKSTRYRDEASIVLRKVIQFGTAQRKNINTSERRKFSSSAGKIHLAALARETRAIRRWLAARKKTGRLFRRTVLSEVAARDTRAKLTREREMLLSLTGENEAITHRLASQFPELRGRIRKTVPSYQAARDALIALSDLVVDDLNRSINRKSMVRENLRMGIPLQYFYRNGASIDVASELSKRNMPFNISMDQFALERLDTFLFTIKTEDSIIFDAYHFTSDLARCHRLPRFHGFLKYLTDICHKLRGGPIDWERVVERAKATNASSQVHFYLNLAKKYLGVPVPSDAIKKLREDSSLIQNFLLDRIDGMKLLFNEPTWAVRGYARMYLTEGILKRLTARAHHLYNRLRI